MGDGNNSSQSNQEGLEVLGDHSKDGTKGSMLCSNIPNGEVDLGHDDLDMATAKGGGASFKIFFFDRAFIN